MDIRQFVTFRTIVDERSYTNAAVKLGYTQSTITAHIQALEEGLGGEVNLPNEKSRQSERGIENRCARIVDDLEIGTDFERVFDEISGCKTYFEQWNLRAKPKRLDERTCRCCFYGLDEVGVG